jgi:hypothetical protein
MSVVQHVIQHKFSGKYGGRQREALIARDPEGTGRQLTEVGVLTDLSAARADVAVIRDGHLGDLLMLTSALNNLRHLFPGLRLHLFTEHQYVEPFQGQPCIDSVHEMSELPKARFSLALDLRRFVERTPDAWTIDRITLFNRAFGITNFEGETRYVLGDDGPERDWALEAMADASPVTAIPEKRMAVVITPQASDPRRWLGQDVIASLVDRVTDAGLVPYVVGPWAKYTPTVKQLAWMVRLSLGVISCDNAGYHMAAALNFAYRSAGRRLWTAALPIFTTVPPEMRARWYGEFCWPYVPDIPCAPCNESVRDGCERECVERLDVDAFWVHASQYLDPDKPPWFH